VFLINNVFLVTENAYLWALTVNYSGKQACSALPKAFPQHSANCRVRGEKKKMMLLFV